jgi:hypothetical protein
VRANPADALGALVVTQDGLRAIVVAVGKARLREAHARGQPAEDLGVRQRLPGGSTAWLFARSVWP